MSSCLRRWLWPATCGPACTTGAYRKLDGAWQRRLRTLVTSKLTLRHLFAIGLPVLVLIGLGICRGISVLSMASGYNPFPCPIPSANTGKRSTRAVRTAACR